MAKPSSQFLASCTQEYLNSPEWCPLKTAIANAVESAMHKSRPEAEEMAETYLVHVTQHLRDIVENFREDGIPPPFEIDNETEPYVRAVVSGNHKSLLQIIRDQDSKLFEKLCGDILEKLGGRSKVSGATNDGGIDFVTVALPVGKTSTVEAPLASRLTVVGQAKRYKAGNNISTCCLREFVGAATIRTHELRRDGTIPPIGPVILAFWTTSAFDAPARQLARDIGLWYLDGVALAHYVVELGLSPLPLGQVGQVEASDGIAQK